MDYLVFGSTMPGRSWDAGLGYRFGLMGKEKDDEMKGTGNSYDFGARIYDPRVGRWLSVDPLQAKYSSFSPYCGMLDNPILLRDVDGRYIDISALTSSQKTQVREAGIRLCSKSSIIKRIYNYQVNSNEQYAYTLSEFSETGSLGNTRSYDTPFYTKAEFRTAIGFNFNSISEYSNSNNMMEITLAEEAIHTGQAIYYGRGHNSDGDVGIKSSKIQLETEARVIRAFSGIVGDEGEGYVKEFAANKEVNSYFDALRTGDKKLIKSTEGAFREQVKALAATVADKYQVSKGELDKYTNEGAKTDFFDGLTKSQRLKN